MKFIETRRQRPGINLTSLIDVLFLLLIFVLLSAKFEEEGGLAVDLPQGTSKELPEEQTIEVVVTSDGVIHLNKQVVAEEQLEAILLAESTKAKESTMVIKGDQAASFGTIAIIVDTAKRVKLKRVAFKIRN